MRASRRACARRGPTCRCRVTTTRPRQREHQLDRGDESVRRAASASAVMARGLGRRARRARARARAAASTETGTGRCGPLRTALERSSRKVYRRAPGARLRRGASRHAAALSACHVQASLDAMIRMPHTLDHADPARSRPSVVIVVCRLRAPAADARLPRSSASCSARTRWRRARRRRRPATSAEFGIVFLMFSIGLEFSLPQLRAMRRAVFGLGLAQVALTTRRLATLVARDCSSGFGWQAGSCSAARWR